MWTAWWGTTFSEAVHLCDLECLRVKPVLFGELTVKVMHWARYFKSILPISHSYLQANITIPALQIWMLSLREVKKEQKVTQSKIGKSKNPDQLCFFVLTSLFYNNLLLCIILQFSTLLVYRGDVFNTTKMKKLSFVKVKWVWCK